jgi:hypothetical protein
MQLHDKVDKIKDLQKQGQDLIREFEQVSKRKVPADQYKAIQQAINLFNTFIKVIQIKAEIQAVWALPVPKLKPGSRKIKKPADLAGLQGCR